MTPTGRILLPLIRLRIAFIFIAVFGVTVVLKAGTRGLNWARGEMR